MSRHLIVKLIVGFFTRWWLSDAYQFYTLVSVGNEVSKRLGLIIKYSTKAGFCHHVQKLFLFFEISATKAFRCLSTLPWTLSSFTSSGDVLRMPRLTLNSHRTIWLFFFLRQRISWTHWWNYPTDSKKSTRIYRKSVWIFETISTTNLYSKNSQSLLTPIPTSLHLVIWFIVIIFLSIESSMHHQPEYSERENE